MDLKEAIGTIRGIIELEKHMVKNKSNEDEINFYNQKHIALERVLSEVE